MNWIWNLFGGKRQYPILRDESGRTLRQRAFALFDNGHKYREVTTMLPITLKTARRYYFAWKREGPNLGSTVRATKVAMKANPDLKRQMAEAIAEELHCPVADILAEMEQPWGYRRAAMGYWGDKIAAEHRRTRLGTVRAAARIVYLTVDSGVSIDDVLKALAGLKPPDNNPKNTS